MRFLLATIPFPLHDNAGFDYALVEITKDTAERIVELIAVLIGLCLKNPKLQEMRVLDDLPRFYRYSSDLAEITRQTLHHLGLSHPLSDGDCFVLARSVALQGKNQVHADWCQMIVREDGVAWLCKPNGRDNVLILSHAIPLSYLQAIAGPKFPA